MSNKYIDAMDVDTVDLDSINLSTCPHCGTDVADGIVSECLGSFQDCPNDINENFELPYDQPLDFNE